MYWTTDRRGLITDEFRKVCQNFPNRAKALTIYKKTTCYTYELNTFLEIPKFCKLAANEETKPSKFEFVLFCRSLAFRSLGNKTLICDSFFSCDLMVTETLHSHRICKYVREIHSKIFTVSMATV